MRILFIITSSIAAVKCEELIKELIKKDILIDCILTEKTKNIINYKTLKNIIHGGIYTDRSEKNNKMFHDGAALNFVGENCSMPSYS